MLNPAVIQKMLQEIKANNLTMYNNLTQKIEQITDNYLEYINEDSAASDDSDQSDEEDSPAYPSITSKMDAIKIILNSFNTNLIEGLTTKLMHTFSFAHALSLIKICIDDTIPKIENKDSKQLKIDILNLCQQQFYTVLAFKIDYLICLIRHQTRSLTNPADRKPDPLLQHEIGKYLLELQQTCKNTITQQKQPFNFSALINIFNYCQTHSASADIKNIVLEIYQMIFTDLQTEEVKKGGSFDYHSINEDHAISIINILIENDKKIPAGELIWRICLGLNSADMDKFITQKSALINQFRSLHSYQNHNPLNNNDQELCGRVINNPKLLVFLTARQLIAIIANPSLHWIKELAKSSQTIISDDIITLYGKSVFHANLNLLNYAKQTETKKETPNALESIANLFSKLITQPQKSITKTLTPQEMLKNKLLLMGFLAKYAEFTKNLINEVMPTHSFIISHGVCRELLPLLEPLNVITLFKQAEQSAYLAKFTSNNSNEFMQFRCSIEYEWLMLRIINDIKLNDVHYFEQLKTIPYILYELLRFSEFYEITPAVIANLFRTLGSEIILDILQFVDTNSDKHELTRINLILFKTFNVFEEKYVVQKNGTQQLFIQLVEILLLNALTDLRTQWLQHEEVVTLTKQYPFLLRNADNNTYDLLITENLTVITSLYKQTSLFEDSRNQEFNEGLLKTWLNDEHIRTQLQLCPSILSLFDHSVINTCAIGSLFLRQLIRQNVIIQFILDNLTLLIDKYPDVLEKAINSLYFTPQTEALVQLIQKINPAFSATPHQNAKNFGVCAEDNLPIDPIIPFANYMQNKHLLLINKLKLSFYSFPIISASMAQQKLIMSMADSATLELELSNNSVPTPALPPKSPIKVKSNLNMTAQQELDLIIANLDADEMARTKQAELKKLEETQRAQIQQLERDTQQKTDENNRKMKAIAEQSQQLEQQAAQLHLIEKEYVEKQRKFEEEQRQRATDLRRLEEQIDQQAQEEEQRRKLLEQKRVEAAQNFDRQQQELQQKIEHESQERQAQLELMQQRHQEEMQKLQQAEDELLRQQKEAQEQFEQTQFNKQQQLETLRDQHRQQLARISSDHSQETQQLNTQKTELSAKHKQEISTLENEIRKLNEDFAAQLKRKKEDLDRRRNETESLKQKYAEEARVKKEAEEERKQKAEELARKQKADEEARLKKEAEEELKRQELLAKRRSQDNAQKKSMQDEFDRNKKAYEDHIRRIGQNADLIKQIEENRKKLEEQKEQLRQRQEELAQLTNEVEAINRKLQEDEQKIELQRRENDIRSADNELKRQQLDAVELEQKSLSQTLERLEEELAKVADERIAMKSQLESFIQEKKNATEKEKAQYQLQAEQLARQQLEYQQSIAQNEDKKKELENKRQQLQQEELLRQKLLLQEEQDRKFKQKEIEEQNRKKQEQYESWLAENNRKQNELEKAMRDQGQVQEQLLAQERELEKIKAERSAQIKRRAEELAQLQQMEVQLKQKLAEEDRLRKKQEAEFQQKIAENQQQKHELNKTLQLIEEQQKNILSAKLQLQENQKQIKSAEDEISHKEKELVKRNNELKARQDKFEQDNRNHEEKQRKLEAAEKLLRERESQLTDKVKKAVDINKQLDERAKKAKEEAEQQLLAEKARQKEEEIKKKQEQDRQRQKLLEEEKLRKKHEEEQKKTTDDQAVLDARRKQLEAERAAQQRVDKNLRERVVELQQSSPRSLVPPSSDAQILALVGINKPPATPSPRNNVSTDTSKSKRSSQDLDEQQLQIALRKQALLSRSDNAKPPGSSGELTSQMQDIGGIIKKKTNRGGIALSNAGFLDTMALEEKMKEEAEQEQKRKAEIEKRKKEREEANKLSSPRAAKK